MCCGQASNPIHTVAVALNVSTSSLVKQLDPPLKIRVPIDLLSGNPRRFSILGLGDMALPGLLLALCACFDQRRCRNDPGANSPISTLPSSAAATAQLQQQGPYLRRATLGYLAGIIAAMLGGMTSRAAQPALMYIVPAVLLPVFCTALQRRELRGIWGGQRPRFCSCCSFHGRTTLKEPDEAK
jgi:minor histocompatibility antigen H13